MLLRSQESSRASSRLWSRVLDIITSVRCHHKRDGVCDSATYKSEHQAEEPLERLRRENPRSRNAREVGPCAFLSTFALYSPLVQEHNCGQSGAGRTLNARSFIPDSKTHKYGSITAGLRLSSFHAKTPNPPNLCVV